jgi:hypothetical protein
MNPGRCIRLSLLQKVQTVFGPIYPLIQWVSGFFPEGKTAVGVKLTTHLHLVQTLSMSGAPVSLPLTSSLSGPVTFSRSITSDNVHLLNRLFLRLFTPQIQYFLQSP